jgi:hypothetical protein
MTNRIFYNETVMGGVKEFAVTLLAGKWSKYRTFATSADAVSFMEQMKDIETKKPLNALKVFMQHGTIGKWQASLSSVVKQGHRIKHRVNCSDGTYSVWVGNLHGDYIERTDETGLTVYTSLNAFIRAHYAEVKPERKRGNGWHECEAKVAGKWVRLNQLRVTRDV